MDGKTEWLEVWTDEAEELRKQHPEASYKVGCFNGNDYSSIKSAGHSGGIYSVKDSVHGVEQVQICLDAMEVAATCLDENHGLIFLIRKVAPQMARSAAPSQIDK
jgi:hypothetical protein